MQPRTLNMSKRYDETFGDSRHRYLQDGVWFDAEGKESGVLDVKGKSHEHPLEGFDETVAKRSLRNQVRDGAGPNVADMSDADIEAELVRRKALRAARSGAPAAERIAKLEAGEINADPPSDDAPSVQLPTDPPDGEETAKQVQLREDLGGMPYAKVRKFAIAGGAPAELVEAKGEGVKQGLVDWLVTHHADKVQVVGAQ